MLIDGTTLTVESKSFTAVLDGARVKSLVDTRTGAEFVRPGEARFPLELTYRGGWQGAADRYRAWMERNYDLAGKRAGRPDWVEGVTLAVCWVVSNPKLLAPLARLNPPDRTLIHLSDWRSDPYDVNYPAYRPSAEGAAFVEKARAMGFRVMPHFNYFGCCKTNPLYERVRDWQARDVVKTNPQGWFLFNAEENIQYRMAYIHPGLARWRRALIDPASDAMKLIRDWIKDSRP